MLSLESGKTIAFFMLAFISTCSNSGLEVGPRNCIPNETLTENGRIVYRYDCWDSGGLLRERKYYKDSIRLEHEYTYYENGLGKSIIRYFDRPGCDKYAGHPVCFAPDGKTEVRCDESLHGCNNAEYSCVEGIDHVCPE